MSRLPKGFSNPSIASTSREAQEGVESGTLCVTLLSSEWRSSTDGDLSTLIRELAIQLAKHPGVQVSVFLPQCSEDDKGIAAGHKVHLIEAEEITGLDPVDWLIKLPEDHAMDCIIGLGVHLGQQIPRIQRNHQCKWIQIVHNAHEALAMYKSNVDAIPRGEKMQQTEIELCELADQVVAVGPKLADTYRCFLRPCKKHQDVIDLTPSIFTEFLDVKQATEERKTFCVLVIGSGDSEDFNLKGYDLAAQAIAELKEKSYQLKFVCAPRGKGNEIAEKLLEHGIDRSQLIVRSFNERRETLARLFCEVDLAIIPSRSEGFGLTGLEALSAGLPVLVSGNSGLGEALMKVPNGSNCVVDSEDPKCWASKIKAVREKDRGVRLEEAKLLREKYLEKYSWEESLDVLVEKMQDLTGSPGRMSASAAYSQLPCAVASQIHERRNYQREDTQRSSDHSGSLSSLEQYQLPCPAGAQTPTQTYQTSHTQSFPGHGSSPSLPEYNQLPFLAGPQTPVQTYQTNHRQTMTLAIDVAAMKPAKQNTQDRTVSAMESEGLQGGEHQAASAVPVSSGQTQASCTGDEAHQVPNPSSSKVTEVLCKIAENYLHNSPPRNEADRNEFSKYLKEMRVTLTGLSIGSLLITVKCDSLQILERLWDDYLSGHLGEVVQSCFVTEEILIELGLAELTLKTTISEEEYKACNKYLRNESGRVSVKSSPQDPQRPRLASADEAGSSVQVRPYLSSKHHELPSPARDKSREEKRGQSPSWSTPDPKQAKLAHVDKAVAFKEGKPGDCDLDELAGRICAKWQELGLRLGISQDKLDEIDANKERKAYRMLLLWRNTTASSTLYRDLYYALCHDRVGLNNVAKEFCVTFPEASTEYIFDVKFCRSKLAEHYKRTATVPTSVWSKTSLVDIHQIYTRLSWVKEEQTPAGSSRSELEHYTDVFTANKKGVVPKRILVQGQTGIGKSTLIKKLAVDWAELDDTTTGDEQKDILKTFELLVVVNLKEVSKCQSLKDVISRSSIFARKDKYLTDSLLNYISNNQDKVLLVFDGYDEYRCGSNSEIYEIFRGNELRNCCVLITTRISKADELREFKDMHAEITGFSEEDRVDFMSRMLGGEAEAKELSRHLFQRKLEDLAKVPLLLLFFCTLWKQGKSKSFPESKSKLYLAMIQYVLDYKQGKDSPARFGKVHDLKDVLAEIGKVALECLLKDDHVFEYDQLSAAVLCDESVIIGLLQVSEYAENLRPAGMVSFIHKSIQEFLAAWFVTYRCVPEGNLGGMEQHLRTLEDCVAWKNVFQFVCGLSDDGAVKVFQHFTSVRMSDPTLDFSKTIPDEENETDVPLCDVTFSHERFSDLVNDCFQEVQSKAALERHWLDCTAGVILIS